MNYIINLNIKVNIFIIYLKIYFSTKDNKNIFIKITNKIKLLHQFTGDFHYLSNSLLPCNIHDHRSFKNKTNSTQKEGKLESFQNNIYFHKLNFYLNKITTIQSFIIHFTSYIHRLTNKDTRLSTSGRPVHWVRHQEVCTCHIPPNCSEQFIPIWLIFQTSDPICTGLIHMSYSDRAHISNLGQDHMNLFRLFTNW